MNDKLYGGRHILLYAKGHYFQSQDLMADLRRLVASYTAQEYAGVTEKDVFTVVCDIAIPLILKNGNPKLRIEEILTDLLSEARLGNVLNTSDFVSSLLSFLVQAKVKDGDTVILELGEPDFNILPPSQ